MRPGENRYRPAAAVAFLRLARHEAKANPFIGDRQPSGPSARRCPLVRERGKEVVSKDNEVSTDSRKMRAPRPRQSVVLMRKSIILKFYIILFYFFFFFFFFYFQAPLLLMGRLARLPPHASKIAITQAPKQPGNLSAFCLNNGNPAASVWCARGDEGIQRQRQRRARRLVTGRSRRVWLHGDVGRMDMAARRQRRQRQKAHGSLHAAGPAGAAQNSQPVHFLQYPCSMAWLTSGTLQSQASFSARPACARRTRGPSPDRSAAWRCRFDVERSARVDRRPIACTTA